MQSNYYKLILKLLNIEYGKGLILKGTPVIFNKKGSSIKIGKDVVIKSSFLSNLVGLSQRTIILTRTEDAKIMIGNNVGISGATIYARKGIFIGDNTCIGGGAKILDNDFHPLEIDKRNALLVKSNIELRESENWISAKKIVIGENCFIGTNAILLKGTELGSGCVVGAAAVVSGKFPPNSVIVGNPAKIIKSINQ